MSPKFCTDCGKRLKEVYPPDKYDAYTGRRLERGPMLYRSCDTLYCSSFCIPVKGTR